MKPNMWTDIENRLKKLLGKHRLENAMKPDMREFPTMTQLDFFITTLLEEHKKERDQARTRRTSRKRGEATWDWEKNYGRRAFSDTKIAYAPPTYALRKGDASDTYETSSERVHDAFLSFWTTIYCAHAEDDPARWNEFFNKYGDYIPRAEYHDKEYRGHEYEDQLKKMSDTSSGFDGWNRKALLSLPSAVWTWRAAIDNLAKRKGIVPDAYLHVISPMLPKGHATTAGQHRGIVVFSFLHRLLYGIEWHRLKWWQEKWLDESQHGGRVSGEHLADAWDVQLKIEAARAEQRPIVGALLDYAIFF